MTPFFWDFVIGVITGMVLTVLSFIIRDSSKR